MMAISTNIFTNIDEFKGRLNCDKNFDIVYRTLTICNRTCALFFVDGFAKDGVMSRIITSFYAIKDENQMKDAHTFSKAAVPYGEVAILHDPDAIITAILSGQSALFVDGFDQAVLIDARTYPQRSTSEPDKDKVFRGSRDGFVETLVLNTALIRRRIRTPDLCVQHISVGSDSKTDLAICYIDGRVDTKLLDKVMSKLQDAKVSALTMNQESVSELLIRKKWYNPFPKFKFTERPDTTAAQLLEGDIAIVVDNSPSVLIVPSTIFHIMEEANDYYFPPLTGTYLRLTRMVIMVLTLLLTPTWILLVQFPEVLPDWLSFILVTDEIKVPLLLQLLILEFAIDGMKLASLNTPNTLTTSLSIIGAIIVGDYAVQSGWFNAQALLYTAFVTLANYSQPGFELGYALKFMRLFLLVLTGAFNIWGYSIGLVLIFIMLVANKTMSGRCYLYPLIPFDWKVLKRHIFRAQLDSENN